MIPTYPLLVIHNHDFFFSSSSLESVKTMHRKIYCPHTNTTYVGHVLANPPLSFIIPETSNTTQEYLEYDGATTTSTTTTSTTTTVNNSTTNRVNTNPQLKNQQKRFRSTSITSVTSIGSNSTNSISSATSKSKKTTFTKPTPSKPSKPIFYIKHGRGTLHFHKKNMVLDGYFQYDELIGTALQTIYDVTGKVILVQYEGSFTSPSSTFASCTTTSCTSSAGSAVGSAIATTSGSDCGTTTSSSTPLPCSKQLILPVRTTSRPSSSSSSSTTTTTNTTNYQRHGYGKVSWPTTGDVYTGQFSHGTMSGNGTFTWGATGDSYKGPWFNGQMHGIGGIKYSVDTRDVFEGNWDHGISFGLGLKRFGCGDIHEGMYEFDKVSVVVSVVVVLVYVEMDHVHGI